MNGKEVLDIGVGIGGPACLLVTNHGAGKVTGIDVEEPVLREARATLSSQNLENQQATTIFLKRCQIGL